MRQQIKFIKWKNLLTKSINDLVVTAFFEISKDMYEKVHNYINKNLVLEIEYNWISKDFSCSICTDTKGYINWADDHWVLKLDIILEDILLCGFILKWNIFLTLE